MKRLLLYILVFKSILNQAQINCDPATLSGLEKKFYKAEKKGKANTYEFAQLTYDIAQCYQKKGDSASLKWFSKYLAGIRASFVSCDGSEVRMRQLLIQMGMSAFYLGRYYEAETYFNKATGISPEPETTYFLALTLMKLDKYPEAMIEFENYKRIASDRKDIEVLQQTCKEKMDQK